MPPKRMKYEARFKMKVVEFAQNMNNSAAARRFGVNEKLVRDWRKNIDKIKLLPRTKCADRSGKCHWPELEESLARWVEENRNSGYVVTRTQIILEATRWANKNGVTDFSGHCSWCSRFMKRHNLVIRQQTKISQKLPTDLEEKITEFQRFIIKCRKRHDYSMASIANMDETPTWFDMPSSKTVNKAGKKTVYVRTSGHEKVRFTTVLACLADGTKLKPMVIFKRKTMPKEIFPPGVVIHVHPKGWMDEDGMKVWIEKVWRARPGGLMKTRTLLVLGSFSGHLTDVVKRSLKEENTDMAVIPGGLTSVIQPFDVCLNKPFKDRLREQWNGWMTSDEKTYTPSGNMQRASLPTVCQWVLNAWGDMKTDSVTYSFKKCGISNTLDGTEDDLLWEEPNAEAADESEADNASELDPYDDRIMEEGFAELFGMSGSSDDEFYGF